MLPEDGTSVVVKFKSKYGTNLQQEELPAQAYFEEFQEKLAAGMFQAGPLDQVISQAEAGRTRLEEARSAEAVWDALERHPHDSNTTSVYQLRTKES